MPGKMAFNPLFGMDTTGQDYLKIGRKQE